MVRPFEAEHLTEAGTGRPEGKGNRFESGTPQVDACCTLTTPQEIPHSPVLFRIYISPNPPQDKRREKHPVP